MPATSAAMTSLGPEAPLPPVTGGVVQVRIAGVSIDFRRPGMEPLLAVDDVSLDVVDGEFVALIGPSGCGKSTLLNAVAGLLQPSTGHIEFAGQPVSDVDRRLGYMFQRDTLLPWATAAENVHLPLDAVGAPNPGEVTRLLDMVGLSRFADYYPGQLSGGMRKRVQLARLLAQEPEVMLLDEPFGALDAQTKLLLQEEFQRLWSADQRSVLFITHDLYEAISLADRVVVMSARPGRIKEIVHIGLPRPREMSSVVGQPEFQRLFHRVWSALRDEIEHTDAMTE